MVSGNQKREELQTRDRSRVLLAVFGAVAGLALWWLNEVMPGLIGNDRVGLALTIAISAFFGTALALAGPLSLSRALAGAVLVSIPAAVLTTVASNRFDTLPEFFATGHPLIALGVVLTVPLPFLSAGLGARRDWFHYPTLFDSAWMILIRCAAAFTFVAVFWGLLLLGDALFGLVGLVQIQRVLEVPWVIYVLTGAVIGFAMAVAHDMSDYISPHMFLCLLRLFIPLVLAVMGVFLIALPSQGVSEVLGGLSAAGTMMLMSVVAATLVTSALDRSDRMAVDTRFLAWCTQALAALLPLMAAMAVYAVVVRVAQYGWTPSRMAALTGASLLLAYGVVYAISVLFYRDWARRIRQGNIWLALLTLAVATVWLSPFFNPQKTSAATQVARFADGDVSVEDLDLWSLGRDWGPDGARALETLKSLDHPDAPRLEQRLSILALAESRDEFDTGPGSNRGIEALEQFLAEVAIRPKGALLPGAMRWSDYTHLADSWAAACDRDTPKGRNGCVAIVADILPEHAGNEIVLFLLASENYATETLIVPGLDLNDQAYRNNPTVLGFERTDRNAPDILDAVIDDNFRFGRKSLNTIEIQTVPRVFLP